MFRKIVQFSFQKTILKDGNVISNNYLIDTMYSLARQCHVIVEDFHDSGYQDLIITYIKGKQKNIELFIQKFISIMNQYIFNTDIRHL